jgi:hypothetical protein
MANEKEITKLLTVTQAAFTGGEVSSAIYARKNLEKYPISCRKLLNFTVSPHGGASTRGGTEHLQYIKQHADDSTPDKVRLIPFEYSADEAYMLEFGLLENAWYTVYKGYIRFFAEGVPVLVQISAQTLWVSGAKTWYREELCRLAGVAYVCVVASVGSTVQPGTTADWYPLDLAVADWSYYELPTIYEEVSSISDVLRLNVEQDEDFMHITRKPKDVYKLQSNGYTAWNLQPVTYGASFGPPTGMVGGAAAGEFWFAMSSFNRETGEESILSSVVRADLTETVSFTAWPSSDADVVRIYVALAEGDVFWFVQEWTPTGGTPWVWTVPTTTLEYNSSITGMIETIDPYPSDGPNVAAFFEQRILYADDGIKPSTFKGSRSGSPDDFNRHYPLVASDADTYKINAKQVNEVRWMVAMDRLLIGTSGSIWSMTAGKNANAVTPVDAPALVKQTDIGVSRTPPVIVGKNVLFIERTNKVIRDLGFDASVAGYDGLDLSLLAEHLFKDDEITSCCYQRDPDSIVWCTMASGKLLGLTYYKEHEIWAWHVHQLGGVGVAAGFAEYVASVRSSDGTDHVYISVKRTVDGDERRSIELMKPRLPNTDMTLAWCVDSGKSYYNATPFGTMTGLDHLEGETVVVLGDGSTYNDPAVPLVVSSGEITLPDSATVNQAQVGLPYTCDLETLDLDAQEGESVLIDKKKRGVEASIRLKEALQLKVGSDEDNLFPVPFRYGEALDDPTELFTGVKTMSIKPALTPVNDADRGTRVFIRVEDPVPVTVQSITAEIEYGEQY